MAVDGWLMQDRTVDYLDATGDLVVGVLTMEWYLPGCRSLKDKRARLRGMRDRFGREPGVAVCESAFADAHQRAQWSFVIAASDRRVVAAVMERIERDVAGSVDGIVSRRHRDLG
jgi:hypothetical protein